MQIIKSTRAALSTILLKINQYTIEKRVRVTIPWMKGDVLDVGCGTGLLAQHVSKGQRYFGIDVNEDKIQSLKLKYTGDPAYSFWTTDVDDDAITGLPVCNSFETITLLAVIEHLRNPGTLLNFLHKVLKDEGHLLMTTPTPIGDKIGQFISTAISGERDFHHPHMRLYDKASLTSLVEEAGFDVLCYRKFELGMNQLLVCSRRPDK